MQIQCGEGSTGSQIQFWGLQALQSIDLSILPNLIPVSKDLIIWIRCKGESPWDWIGNQFWSSFIVSIIFSIQSGTVVSCFALLECETSWYSKEVVMGIPAGVCVCVFGGLDC